MRPQPRSCSRDADVPGGQATCQARPRPRDPVARGLRPRRGAPLGQARTPVPIPPAARPQARAPCSQGLVPGVGVRGALRGEVGSAAEDPAGVRPTSRGHGSQPASGQAQAGGRGPGAPRAVRWPGPAASPLRSRTRPAAHRGPRPQAAPAPTGTGRKPRCSGDGRSRHSRNVAAARGPARPGPQGRLPRRPPRAVCPAGPSGAPPPGAAHGAEICWANGRLRFREKRRR